MYGYILQYTFIGLKWLQYLLNQKHVKVVYIPDFPQMLGVCICLLCQFFIFAASIQTHNKPVSFCSAGSTGSTRVQRSTFSKSPTFIHSFIRIHFCVSQRADDIFRICTYTYNNTAFLCRVLDAVYECICFSFGTNTSLLLLYSFITRSVYRCMWSLQKQKPVFGFFLVEIVLYIA